MNPFKKDFNMRILVLIASSLLIAGCGECGDCADEAMDYLSADSGTATTVSLVEPITKSWTVQGMHCGGCANAISSKVAKISGVESCVVNFDTSTAVVITDPAKTTEIENAMTTLGYTISPAEGS